MTPTEALAVVRQVCDAHLCNKANRATIDAALDQLAAALDLAGTVDDTPAAGNGRHAVRAAGGAT